MPVVADLETKAQLEEAVQSGKVLVFFVTPFSKAAKAIDPQVVELAADHLEDFRVVRVDISLKNGIGQSLKVNKVPAFHFYVDGAVTKKLTPTNIGQVAAEIESQGW